MLQRTACQGSGAWHAEERQHAWGLLAKRQHAVTKHAGGGGIQLRGDMWDISCWGGWEAV
jgi:hypothetical protein